ncbi:MAG: HD domain-containing protein [Alphaproteobacteria bacterium]|nr:HD domain-containing protein [Alphaproteobacteria bacterium]
MIQLNNEEVIIWGVATEIIKPMYTKNDGGHQWDHGVNVASLALEINGKLGLGVNRKEIILAGLCHDIFAHVTTKAMHHIMGAEYLITHNTIKNICYDLNMSIARVATAILEHRASWTGEFGCPLCQLISSADRLSPDLSRLIQRMKRCSEGDSFHKYQHIIDKFGRNGYAKYPDFYRRVFGKELEYMWSLIDDEVKLKSYYFDDVPVPIFINDQ